VREGYHGPPLVKSALNNLVDEMRKKTRQMTKIAPAEVGAMVFQRLVSPGVK
jgi:hypothetical protein